MTHLLSRDATPGPGFGGDYDSNRAHAARQRNGVSAVYLASLAAAGADLPAAQERALRGICARYHVEYRREDYRPAFDLPKGYVGGWVGGYDIQATHPTLYIGCDPEGRISS
jgi:hypothetical protein